MVIDDPKRLRAFRLRAIALAVSLEGNKHGFRVTRGRSALSIAKRETGNKTNDRLVQIALLSEKAEEMMR